MCSVLLYRCDERCAFKLPRSGGASAPLCCNRSAPPASIAHATYAGDVLSSSDSHNVKGIKCSLTASRGVIIRSLHDK